MPETKPLAGKRILVTRPSGRAEPLLARLESLGAEAISLPVIRIEPFADLSRLDQALARLGTYDWVVFTSAQAVEITWGRLPHSSGPRQLAGRRLAAIGPATARSLEQHGLSPTLVPGEFVAEGLIDALGDVDGQHILLPRAEGARDVLPETLTDRGARVDEIPIYRAVPTQPDGRALEEIRRGIDAVTFTSPSTVRAFGAILAVEGLDPLRLPGNPACACIGPITAAAASAAGYRPAVLAKVYTTDGLVEALCSFFLEG